MNRVNLLFLPAAAGTLMALSAGAAGPIPGDLWENTTQMAMPGMGMAMPARTQQSCLAKNSNEPPVSAPDKNCEMYDVSSSGSTTRWKMRCTGQQAMSGEGEITYQGRESYNGSMTMSMDGQTMNMKMSGKRIGDCDAGAMAASMAAAQKQVEQGKAQTCASLVQGMQVQYFDGTLSMDCEAKYKTDFCNRLSSEEGFDTVAVREKSPLRPTTDLEAAATTCGVNAATVQSNLCGKAKAGDSLLFLARHCPAEAAPLAQKECAGRSFTGSSVAPKYQEFCSTYARHNLMQGSAAGATPGASSSVPGQASGGAQPTSAEGQAETPAPSQESTVEKSKKALKKIFPF
jgi:hypothetical protein